MANSTLRHLQDLGIDIWVTQEHSRELLENGKALPVYESERSQGSLSQTQRRTRLLKSVKSTESAGQSPSSRTNQSAKPAQSKPRTTRPAVEEPERQPFSIRLKLFKFGQVAMFCDEELRYSDKLISDVMRSIEQPDVVTHHLNQFDFIFPFESEEGGAAATGATEEVAKSALKGRLNRLGTTEFLFVVGRKVIEFTRDLSLVPKTLAVVELPQESNSKKALWQDISKLQT